VWWWEEIWEDWDLADSCEPENWEECDSVSWNPDKPQSIPFEGGGRWKSASWNPDKTQSLPVGFHDAEVQPHSSHGDPEKEWERFGWIPRDKYLAWRFSAPLHRPPEVLGATPSAAAFVAAGRGAGDGRCGPRTQSFNSSSNSSLNSSSSSSSTRTSDQQWPSDNTGKAQSPAAAQTEAAFAAPSSAIQSGSQSEAAAAAAPAAPTRSSPRRPSQRLQARQMLVSIG